MGSHEGPISVLEAELGGLEPAFAGLSDDQWRLPTRLVPLDPGLPHRSSNWPGTSTSPSGSPGC